MLLQFHTNVLIFQNFLPGFGGFHLIYLNKRVSLCQASRRASLFLNRPIPTNFLAGRRVYTLLLASEGKLCHRVFSRHVMMCDVQVRCKCSLLPVNGTQVHCKEKYIPTLLINTQTHNHPIQCSLDSPNPDCSRYRFVRVDSL